jgi:hypothetical protein
VIIAGEVKGIGYGKSKKEAEQEAARKALENVNEMSDDKVQSSNEIQMAQGQSLKDPVEI